MQILSATVCMLLCAMASFAEAVHYHHPHRPGGYGSGINSGGTAPFSSGAPSNAPYPVGNGTVGGLAGTGTRSIRTTITTIIQSTSYVTAPEGGGPQTSAGGAGASGGAAPPASGAQASLSGVTGDTGRGASSCASPVTVTITTDTTVTVTQVSSPSESQASVESPSTTISQAPIQSLAPVVPQSSVSIAAAGSSVGDGLSRVTAVTFQPPSSTSNVVVEKTDGQVGSTAPSEVGSAIPASSTATSVSIASATPVAPTSSSVAASTASSSPSTAPVGSKNLIPNGIKAGVAGYRSITGKSSWSKFSPHIGWYSDYWPNTPDSGSVTGVPMVSTSPTIYAYGRSCDTFANFSPSHSSGATATKAAMTPLASRLSKP